MTMHTRIRGMAAALAVAASMTLTACSDDAQSTDNDKIAGAESSSESSSSSASPSDDGIDRPEINLPKDVKNIFEERQTGDTEKDAVLADNERRINSIDDAVLRADLKSPALSFYSADAALVSGYKWVKSFLDEGISFTGTTRYFDRSVTMSGKGAATVTYCADESQAFNKDRKTGKVDREAPSADSYVFYNTRLKKNATGVWQTTFVTSERGAKECQR
ncbi:hypothetical protein [Streptomyces sp. 7N604]|uniref:hypothetical protein n=1 Tax=Streptomyces sp. 7N604 TaxID=3457415 RepID=UPI003FD66F64